MTHAGISLQPATEAKGTSCMVPNAAPSNWRCQPCAVALVEPETKLRTEDKCEETQVIFLWNRIDVIHMTSLYILSFSKISSTKSVALKIFQLTGVAADDRDPECCADHCHLDDQLLESAGMWILFEMMYPRGCFKRRMGWTSNSPWTSKNTQHPL